MKISRAASVSLLLGTSMLVLAGPAAAETLTVTDISIPIGNGIEIASVSVEDGNLSEEGLRALLSENPAASLASLATQPRHARCEVGQGSRDSLLDALRRHRG